MPQHGRAFLPEEEARDRNFVTLLSHGLWQRRFGGDPQVIGKALTLDSAPHIVVGLMPPGFAKPPEAIVFAKPLPENLAGDVRTPLLLILGAVGAVLLIACANGANLLLARATARGREIAVRCALGASPWRIVRPLLVESLLLAAAGGAFGLALASWGVRALGALVVDRVSYLQETALDPAVLLFTLGVTLATVVFFGLAPALRGARTDLQQAVKDGARAGRGRRAAA